MAKKYKWNVTETLEDGGSAEHTVELTCSFLTGKAIINIEDRKSTRLNSSHVT